MEQFVPVEDSEALWNLQLELLHLAEQILGPRDKTKKIGAPSFHNEIPYTQLTANRDGAVVVLSRGAERYLPTTIYEMAHETVHLLNPVERDEANYLEEGIAVEFSIVAQRHFNVLIQKPETGRYSDALRLVRLLPPSPMEAGRTVREKIGALSKATFTELEEMFEDASREDLRALCDKFYSG